MSPKNKKVPIPEDQFKAQIGVSKFTVERAQTINETLGRQRILNDPFETLYADFDSIIRPPIRFDTLYTWYEESDILQTCITSLVKNIDGFGYDLHFLGDDVRERNSPEAQRQELFLRNFFDNVNEDESMETLRGLVNTDKWVLGNAAIEVIRRPRTNQIAMLYHMPTLDTRMCRLDDEPVNIRCTIPREGKDQTFVLKKRFRRFCQVQPGSDMKLRWFKSFGDKRYLDAITGEYKKSPAACKEVATELIWLKENLGGRTYGIPKWIGCITDVMGRALSQYVNYDLFDNQGISPMLILVENGALTDESKEELQALVDSMRGSENFNRIGLIEAVPAIAGLDDNPNVRVTLKNMTEYRKEDQMFQNYLKYTVENVRQTFRLPAMYVGGVNAYSYSTAITAQHIGEQQVFIPERLAFDEVVNRKLVWDEFGCRLWRYVSRGPKTVGAEDVRQAIQQFGQQGAITVNNAIDMFNSLLTTNYSKYDAEWANFPYPMVAELLKTGRLRIPELEGEDEQGGVLDRMSSGEDISGDTGGSSDEGVQQSIRDEQLSDN